MHKKKLDYFVLPTAKVFSADPPVVGHVNTNVHRYTLVVGQVNSEVLNFCDVFIFEQQKILRTLIRR